MPFDEEEWRLPIRRAFRIPDLVGDEVAAEVIFQVAYEPRHGVHPIANISLRERVGLALIDTTVGAGLAGELERFLMSREEEVIGRSSGLLEVAGQHKSFSRATSPKRGLESGRSEWRCQESADRSAVRVIRRRAQ